MDWDNYLLPLPNAYNLQVHGFVRVSSFRLVLTRTLRVPATVSSRRTNRPTDDDKALPTSEKMDNIKRATDLCQEANKNLILAPGLYTKEYNRRVCFAPIFLVGDYILLDWPPLFRSDVEPSAFKGYKNITQKKRILQGNLHKPKQATNPSKWTGKYDFHPLANVMPHVKAPLQR